MGLLQSQSIAVIGASERHNSFGERCLRYFRKLDFTGRVYCVNPKYRRVNGYDCYPSIEAIDAKIDAAVLAVPKAAVIESMEALGKKGVKNAVVLSAGFAESGSEGAALQRKLAAVADRYGIRFLGPNTNGAVNIIKGGYLGVSSLLERPRMVAGQVAVVGQSGSLSASVADAMMDFGIGISYVLSIGNAVNINAAQVLEALTGDEHTNAAFFILENVGDGPGFISALRKFVRAGKRMVVLKVGRSKRGGEIAATHSGAVAGSWQTFRMLTERAGAVVVETPEQGINALRIPFSIGEGRTQVISMSGALCGMACDEMEQYGLPMAELTNQVTLDRLAGLGFIPPLNPLDFGRAPRPEDKRDDFGAACRVLLESDEVDCLLVVSGLTHHLKNMAGQLSELRRKYVKPMVVSLMPGSVSSSVNEQLADEGIPVFQEIRTAVQALAGCMTRKTPEEETSRTPAEWKQSHKDALTRAAGNPTEYHLANYFRSYGITYPPMTLADSAGAAVNAARSIGFPVVLKVSSARALHKTQSNLVYLPVADEDETRDAFKKCKTAAQALGVWEGEALVMKFLKQTPRVELLLGARMDVEFGPVLVFGLGGTGTEALQAVCISPLAHTRSQAEAVISCNKAVSKLLPPRDNAVRKDLLDVILNFSRSACHALTEFSELEINPLVVTDRHCFALDAAAVAG